MAALTFMAPIDRVSSGRPRRSIAAIWALYIFPRRDLAAPPLKLRLGYRLIADFVHGVVDFAAVDGADIVTEGPEHRDHAVPAPGAE